jgi:hypothetical protein
MQARIRFRQLHVSDFQSVREKSNHFLALDGMENVRLKIIAQAPFSRLREPLQNLPFQRIHLIYISLRKVVLVLL